MPAQGQDTPMEFATLPLSTSRAATQMSCTHTLLQYWIIRLLRLACSSEARKQKITLQVFHCPQAIHTVAAKANLHNTRGATRKLSWASSAVVENSRPSVSTNRSTAVTRRGERQAQPNAGCVQVSHEERGHGVPREVQHTHQFLEQTAGQRAQPSASANVTVALRYQSHFHSAHHITPPQTGRTR